MSFFPVEPVPVDPPPRAERAEDPPWSGPPVGEVPVALPVAALLASNHHAAVVLRSVRVFSNGMELEIQGTLRRAGATDEQWESLQGRFSKYRRAAGRNTGRLRVGVELADGSRALNAPYLPDHDEGEGPGGYRLTRGGGGGSGSDTFHDTSWTFWLWPLPPDGPISVIVDWVAVDLPEQRFEFDAGTVSDAARRAVTIWPAEGSRPAGTQPSWTISF